MPTTTPFLFFNSLKTNSGDVNECLIIG